MVSDPISQVTEIQKSWWRQKLVYKINSAVNKTIKAEYSKPLAKQSVFIKSKHKYVLVTSALLFQVCDPFFSFFTLFFLLFYFWRFEQRKVWYSPKFQCSEYHDKFNLPQNDLLPCAVYLAPWIMHLVRRELPDADTLPLPTFFGITMPSTRSPRFYFYGRIFLTSCTHNIKNTSIISNWFLTFYK